MRATDRCAPVLDRLLGYVNVYRLPTTDRPPAADRGEITWRFRIVRA